MTDGLFEAVAEECGIDWQCLNAARKRGRAPMALKTLGKAVRDIDDMGGKPDEVPRRAEVYRNRWPGIALTPLALAKHWPSLVPPKPKSTITDAQRENLARMFEEMDNASYNA